MGKRKIGEIYNRPIIEGDINLKTSSEIHKSELSVPQSGGGESGGGDAPSGDGVGELEYFDLSNETSYAKETLCYKAIYAKCYGVSPMGEVKYTRLPIGLLFLMKDQGLEMNVTALAIEMNAPIMSSVGEMSVREHMYQSYGKDFIDSYPRLTEEEFYNLEA